MSKIGYIRGKNDFVEISQITDLKIILLETIKIMLKTKK